jgi:altronate dehydratase large subunit
MKFMGYKRSDGKTGVRNHVAVIPSVFCANRTAERIASQVEGVVSLRHPVGCGQVGYDFELTARTLIAMGTHPNVAAVIVLGLGCERFKPDELFEGIKKSARPVAKFVIQEEGGTAATIEKAVKSAKEFVARANEIKRVECDLSELMVALKCGGTDATSGLAANPAIGAMSDRLIKEGGSSIFAELNELLGTEDILAKRAVNAEIAKKIYNAIYYVEEVLRSSCDDRFPNRNLLISPGNFDGGVSSIVEKALGGVHKSGYSPITDVLEYATRPQAGQKGLFLMNYESHDGEVTTGMVGCGAQIVAFTTGRGNPTGFPLAPVIKVTGNAITYEKMKGDFDFSAAGIISDGVSIKDMGDKFLDLVLRVANGELTAAENMDGNELFCIGRRHGAPHSVIEARRKCFDNACAG